MRRVVGPHLCQRQLRRAAAPAGRPAVRRRRRRYRPARCTRHRRAYVRCRALVAGRIETSSACAAPRSEPCVLSMPTNAAAATAASESNHASAAPPAAASSASSTRLRRRPTRSADEGPVDGAGEHAGHAGAQHDADVVGRKAALGEVNRRQHADGAGGEAAQQRRRIDQAAVAAGAAASLSSRRARRFGARDERAATAADSRQGMN